MLPARNEFQFKILSRAVLRNCDLRLMQLIYSRCLVIVSVESCISFTKASNCQGYAKIEHILNQPTLGCCKFHLEQYSLNRTKPWLNIIKSVRNWATILHISIFLAPSSRLATPHWLTTTTMNPRGHSSRIIERYPSVACAMFLVQSSDLLKLPFRVSSWCQARRSLTRWCDGQ